MIPDSSGQLAELIVYITSTRVDLYSHQILFLAFKMFILQNIYLMNVSIPNEWNNSTHNTMSPGSI